MKKLFLLLMALTLCLFISSCEVSETVSGLFHKHEFGEWEVTTKVNCFRDGVETRKCACGESETRVVPTSGHVPDEWVIVTDATCSVKGLKKRSCSVCMRPLDEEDIPTAEHSFVEVATVSPGCLTRGYTLMECENCHEETTANHTSALGHDCDEYTKYNYDATVSKDGSVSGECKRCNNEVKKALEGSAALLAGAFEGKKISILGDSISTYYGVSNADAANITNSTIRESVLYYDEAHAQALGVKREDTWWQRTADSLGGKILVNNSWSGSYILKTSTNTRPTPGAYLDRCVNLHDNTGSDAGTNPDIIFVYLGTNDYYGVKESCGSAASVDYSALDTKLGADYVPKNVAEAYAIMLYKMKAAYPNAEIYCLNILESRSSDSSLTVFNNMIADVAERMECKYVDICADSAIKNNAYYESYVPSDDGDGSANTLHPNSPGMKSIADCLLEVIEKESKYAPDFEALID